MDLIPELKARFLPFLFLKSWFDQSDSVQLKTIRRSIQKAHSKDTWEVHSKEATQDQSKIMAWRHSKIKVSSFIQDTRIFQKRKLFNVSDSCLLALMACLMDVSCCY